MLIFIQLLLKEAWEFQFLVVRVSFGQSKMAETRVIFVIILVTVLLFVGGFLIGYFTSPSKSDDDDKEPTTKEPSRFEAHRKLYTMLDAESIREYLK